MKVFRYLRSRAFQTYFLSYVGILLVASGMLCVIAILHMANGLREENLRVSRNKLYTIVEDLELQIESMQGIAHEVAILPQFRQNYLDENKYHEIEMLDSFKNYQQPFSIYDGYFLKYKDRDIIYTSQGKTSRFESWYRAVISDQGFEDINLLCEKMCEGKTAGCVAVRQDDNILFLYSLQNYAYGKSGRKGVLGFLISVEGLERRIAQLVMLTEGELALYFRDFCMLDNMDSDSTVSENMIDLYSSKRNFHIYFELDDNEYFLWSNIISKSELAGFLFIFVVLLGLGFFVALWNYRPIREIADKYRDTTEEGLEAEWDSIDALIGSLLQGRKQNSELLQKQYRIIREQIISLIVSGKYSERTREHMFFMNICLEAKVYGVIHCVFPADLDLKQEREWMHKAVNDLSGDDISLYSCWNESNVFVVLAAVEEKYQLEEVKELLQSLFETKSWTVQYRITDVGNELDQIGKSPDYTDHTWMEDTSGREKNNTARQVVEYIRNNCTEFDLSLDLIAGEFQISTTYLCRIIKQEVGKSYKEYLTELRMLEAKKLLQDNKDISVEEVCQRTGYTNVSHFIKIFRKYEGVTPAKYRDEENGF